MYRVICACWWVSVILLASGCASQPPQVKIEPRTHLADEVFAGYQQIEVESQQQVFGLSADMQHFVDKQILRVDDPKARIRNLIKGIFDRSHMNLLYDSHANTTAEQTFENRIANCLSMSIMTFAMAEYAGMDVRFQDVAIPEFWTREQGYSMLNGHINLKILPRNQHNTTYIRKGGMEVDFDPQGYRVKFPAAEVSQQMVLAMFYNNKAADYLVDENYPGAYAYLRAAALTSPQLSETWVNLGVLYRLNGMLDRAEQAYQQAIALNGSQTAEENLAHLYNLTGRHQMAESILARIERKRLANPYYHYLLAEQEFERSHWREAIDHYRRAVALDKNKHEFYFGLAKTYYQLGDITATERYLRMAKRRSVFEQDEQRYQTKLSLLTRL
ncbi:tetratricopeptide repeat protein [Lacimicrobium sp. SS2-24]|uniref:tetratricopeptide repeat protein n=1 Tax=Lacimicrobium sp. SS2-24 TaxID=2005569 RepID=UPI000B4AB42D|nr:tetratricopeptide repeat protein [Lacimicrobium sp. SS2-24]